MEFVTVSGGPVESSDKVEEGVGGGGFTVDVYKRRTGVRNVLPCLTDHSSERKRVGTTFLLLVTTSSG